MQPEQMQSTKEHNQNPGGMQAGKSRAVVFWVFASALFFVGAVLTAVDAIMMAVGARQMAPGEAATLMGVGALSAAILKAAWMVAAREFFQRRLYGLCLVAIFSGVALHTFSITAMTGIAAVGRDGVISSRGHDQNKRLRAVKRYETALAAVRQHRATRAASSIRYDLTRMEKRLASAEADIERSEGWREKGRFRLRRDRAQGQVDALQAELQVALAAKQAREELNAAKNDLDQIQAPQHSDPQAAAIARYPIGLTEDDVAMLLPLMPSLLIEWGGAIAWLFAGAFADFAAQARAERKGQRPLPLSEETIETARATRTTGATGAIRTARTARTKQGKGMVLTVSGTPLKDIERDQGAEPRQRTPSQVVDILRPRVLELKSEGFKQREIAAKVGIGKTTVQRIVSGQDD